MTCNTNAGAEALFHSFRPTLHSNTVHRHRLRVASIERKLILSLRPGYEDAVDTRQILCIQDALDCPMYPRNRSIPMLNHRRTAMTKRDCPLNEIATNHQVELSRAPETRFVGHVDRENPVRRRAAMQAKSSLQLCRPEETCLDDIIRQRLCRKQIMGNLL